MYAIIDDNGKQRKVSEGDIVRIDRPYNAEEKSITFDRVLLVGGDDVKVGSPAVAGASVTADVLRQVKDKKIVIQKWKRRKGDNTKSGHRQKYTEVKITGISV
ncbi:MAG: 50S ribosomal protein L21 [Planctomycetota bacterium]